MAKIHFLNVDEGDCSIIEHDNGKITMIDICCGNIEGGENMSETFSKSSVNNIKGNYNQKAYPTNPVEYLKEHQETTFAFGNYQKYALAGLHIHLMRLRDEYHRNPFDDKYQPPENGFAALNILQSTHNNLLLVTHHDFICHFTAYSNS